MGYESHSGDYAPDAWKQYSIEELGQWVALLTKRAAMRTDPAKAAKDIKDAANYADMIRDAVKEQAEKLEVKL